MACSPSSQSTSESDIDLEEKDDDLFGGEDKGISSSSNSDKELGGASEGDTPSEGSEDEELPGSNSPLKEKGFQEELSRESNAEAPTGRQPEAEVPHAEGSVERQGAGSGDGRAAARGEDGGSAKGVAAEQPGGPNQFYKYKKRVFSLMKAGQKRFQSPVPMQQISFIMSCHGRFHVRSTQSLKEDPAIQQLIPEVAEVMAARFELKRTELKVVRGARERRRLARQEGKSSEPAPPSQKPQSMCNLLKKRARRIASAPAYKDRIGSVMEMEDGEFCTREKCPQSHADLGTEAPCFKTRAALQLPDNLPLLKNAGLYNSAELRLFVPIFQAFEVLDPVDDGRGDGRATGERAQPERPGGASGRRTTSSLKLTARSINTFNKDRGVQPKSRIQVHSRRIHLVSLAKGIVEAGGLKEFKNRNGFDSFIESKDGLGYEFGELSEEELAVIRKKVMVVEKEYLRSFLAHFLRQAGKEVSSGISDDSDSCNDEEFSEREGDEQTNEADSDGVEEPSEGTEDASSGEMSEGELTALQADLTAAERTEFERKMGRRKNAHEQPPTADMRGAPVATGASERAPGQNTPSAQPHVEGSRAVPVATGAPEGGQNVPSKQPPARETGAAHVASEGGQDRPEKQPPAREARASSNVTEGGQEPPENQPPTRAVPAAHDTSGGGQERLENQPPARTARARTVTPEGGQERRENQTPARAAYAAPVASKEGQERLVKQPPAGAAGAAPVAPEGGQERPNNQPPGETARAPRVATGVAIPGAGGSGTRQQAPPVTEPGVRTAPKERARQKGSRKGVGVHVDKGPSTGRGETAGAGRKVTATEVVPPAAVETDDTPTTGLRRGDRKRKATAKVGGSPGGNVSEAARFVDSDNVFYAGDSILVDEDRTVRGREYDRLKRMQQLEFQKKKRSDNQQKRRKIARDEVVRLRVHAAERPDCELFKTTTDDKVHALLNGEWIDLWNTSMALRREVAALHGLDISGLTNLEICTALRSLGEKMFFRTVGIEL